MGELSIANGLRSYEKIDEKRHEVKVRFYWFSYEIDVLLNVKLVIQYLSSGCLHFIRLLP